MMKRFVLFTLQLALATSVCLAAQAPVQLHRSDLSRTPVAAREFKITIQEVNNGLFGRGPFVIEVEVENTGPSAAPFDPQRLSFVRGDGRQVDVLAVVMNPDIRVAPRELLLLGGARSKQTYVLNGKLAMPAKMYYQGNLVVELVD